MWLSTSWCSRHSCRPMFDRDPGRLGGQCGERAGRGAPADLETDRGAPAAGPIHRPLVAVPVAVAADRPDAEPVRWCAGRPPERRVERRLASCGRRSRRQDRPARGIEFSLLASTGRVQRKVELVVQHFELARVMTHGNWKRPVELTVGVDEDAAIRLVPQVDVAVLTDRNGGRAARRAARRRA
jgi:hypothetical protein